MDADEIARLRAIRDQRLVLDGDEVDDLLAEVERLRQQVSNLRGHLGPDQEWDALERERDEANDRRLMAEEATARAEEETRHAVVRAVEAEVENERLTGEMARRDRWLQERGFPIPPREAERDQSLQRQAHRVTVQMLKDEFSIPEGADLLPSLRAKIEEARANASEEVIGKLKGAREQIGRVMAQGKGEWGQPGYVQDSTWAGWFGEARALDRMISELEAAMNARVKPAERDEERRRLMEIAEAVAKCDPVYDSECALCGVGDLDRFEDGPEKHAKDCPWRLARANTEQGRAAQAGKEKP